MNGSKPHPGIRIHSIPAAEGGGLIFAAGITTMFLLAVPAFLPIVAASVVLGVLLAPVLHRLGH